MNILITGRHVDVTADFKAYVEEKVSKLPRFYDRIQSIEVIVEQSGNQRLVELIVTVEHQPPFVAKEQANDGFSAVDLLVEKMERQLNKHKERFRNRKHLVKKPEIEAL